LPRLLRIGIGDGAASAQLRELLQMGVRESSASRPGAESMLAKLSELMFVEALRRYAEDLPPQGKGWLAGVRDKQIGRALAVLHGDPGRAWTVDELAREAALSRSALAERFTALVGEPPIQYLMRWRLALAAQALRAGGEAITRVAERSGYESEAAFSRAFKREFGLPPAAWRKAAPA
jgi:AraC-like DNA-binding protein